MGGAEITKKAKDQVAKLTGLTPDMVCGMYKDTDGWHVTMDMVEMKRCPSSTDVLGTYETLVDDDGILITYKRVRRYCRSEAA